MAQYQQSGALKPLYSVANKSPRHAFVEAPSPRGNARMFQEPLAVPKVNMSRVIEPKYDAPCNCRMESMHNRSDSYFDDRGSNMLRCTSVLGEGWKADTPEVRSYQGPCYPNTRRSNNRDSWETPGAFQSSEDISSLGSIEMERQPANLGCGPFPDQGPDFSSSVCFNYVTLGYEIRPTCGHPDFYKEPMISGDHEDPTGNTFWSMQSLPERAYKCVASPGIEFWFL